MATVVLRNLVHDIVWALLALATSLSLLTPSLSVSLHNHPFWLEAGLFVAATVLPSVVVWSVFAFNGLKFRVPRALCCQVIVTVLSLALFYFWGGSVKLTGRESDIALVGFGVFGGLKVLDFLFVKFRRALLGVGKRVLIVGNGLQAELLEEFIARNRRRYVLLGRVPCSTIQGLAPSGAEPGAADGRPFSLLRLARNFMADQIVVCLAERRGVFPVEELLSCKLNGMEVLDAPSFYENAHRKLLIENITPSWFIFSHGFRVTWTLRLCKRVLDIAASLAGLAFFLPFIPFIVLAIKLDSPGPMLFRQSRVGEGDRAFTLMKFRSMRQDAEAGTGAVWAREHDPRITRVGNFLRRTRLDEIPQLVNILRGDMSLVGPRPERPEFVAELKKKIPYYSERHYVKPGLTGWAQVCYPYGSSVEDAIEKLRFDLYYIKNISIILDFYIIMKTFRVVLLGKGR